MYKIADVVEWQTRQTQNLLIEILYGFKSHYWHHTQFYMKGCGLMSGEGIVCMLLLTAAMPLACLLAVGLFNVLGKGIEKAMEVTENNKQLHFMLKPEHRKEKVKIRKKVKK